MCSAARKLKRRNGLVKMFKTATADGGQEEAVSRNESIPELNPTSRRSDTEPELRHTQTHINKSAS